MHINHHPDEERHFRTVEKVMTDKRPFAVQSSVADVWMMISALQFCTRVDHLAPQTREWFERIARGLVHVIAATHPTAVELVEMGFDPQHDVVRVDDEDEDEGSLASIFGVLFDDDDSNDEDDDEDYYADDAGMTDMEATAAGLMAEPDGFSDGETDDYPDHDEDF